MPLELVNSQYSYQFIGGRCLKCSQELSVYNDSNQNITYIQFPSPEYFENLYVLDNKGTKLDFIIDESTDLITAYFSPNSPDISRYTNRTIIIQYEICILDKKEMKQFLRENPEDNSFTIQIPLRQEPTSIKFESFSLFDLKTAFLLYDTQNNKVINLRRNDGIRDNYIDQCIFTNKMSIIKFTNNLNNCKLLIVPSQILKFDRAIWYFIVSLCGIFIIILSVLIIIHNQGINEPVNKISILPLQSGMIMVLVVIRSWLFIEEQSELPNNNPLLFGITYDSDYSRISRIKNVFDDLIRNKLTKNYSYILLTLIILLIICIVPDHTFIPIYHMGQFIIHFI